MRIDIFLKKTGISASRTRTKNINITVNGQRKKPSYEVRVYDIIEITDGAGNHMQLEVLGIPSSSISKDEREKYIKVLKKGKVPVSNENFLKWLFENY
ncbi:MAG TPA: hypothetical protein PKU94_01530 [Candidatus Hydrothermia bacterium]|nr:hypothetical protein [Candidatus Hydrothermae bacterium]MDD3649170.1 hypothetical protein [Candidatus Hydrothermia bacterium]MDD5572161.1 hypothetical protein [Candidatus Hydrothermia bacterium]HOK23366.1 hypothetical protein [Candidatus Hydrothermia bacterium]HOL24176.1 hypothetical protein [Candidatus Hydrothermia bacterium]